MPANTRARSDALQVAARAFIDAIGLDVRESNTTRTMALSFATAEGCTVETARRHLARAARRMRGELSAETWGGKRDGAGRPKREPLP